MERLVISIDGDSSGLTKALTSAETRLNSFNTRLSNSSRALTRLMGSLSGLSASVGQLTAANMSAAASLTALASRVNSTSVANNRYAASARRAATSTGVMNVGVRDLVMGMTSMNTLFYTSSFLFGGIIKSTIDANAKFEKMTVLLKNISGGATEAQKQLMAKKDTKFLFDLGDKVPFEVDKMSKAFVKLKSNGIDPTNGSLRALTDGIAYFGGGSEELERASTAIGQMLSKGTVQLEDLKGQLAETGGIPSAIKVMSEAAGFGEKNMKGFYKAMKDGAVDSATTIPKFLDLLKDKYHGAGMEMMNTWSGVTTRMSNAWNQALIRMTQESGDTGVFNVIKKKLTEFLTFLNTKQGDNFLKEVSNGLGKLATAIADGLQWLYKYRETIISVGTALAKLWLLGRGIAMFKAMSGSVGLAITSVRSLLGVIPTTIAFMSRLASVTTGTRLVTLLFGENVRRLAGTLGLFNAKAQISRSALALLAGGFTLIAAAVAGFAYSLYAQSKRVEESKQATGKYKQALDNSSKSVENATNLIDALNSAQGSEINKIKALINIKVKESQTRLRNAKAIYIEAKAKAQAAESSLKVAQATSKKAGTVNLPSTGFKVLGGIVPGGGIIGEGIKGVYRSFFGYDPTSKTGAANANNNRAQANFKAAEGALKNEIDGLETIVDGWNTYAASDIEIKTPKIGGDGDGDKKKTGKSDAEKAADKAAAELDRLREKWAALKVQQDQLVFEGKNGTAEGFDTDTAQEQADIAAKALGTIEIAKTAINGIKDQNRDLGINLKFSKVIEGMDDDITTAAQELNDALDVYNDVDRKITAKIDKFKRGLNAKYADEIRTYGSDTQKVLEIQNRINTQVDQYTQKILVEQASAARDSNKALIESLMTEDEAREYNYVQEVARIYELIRLLGQQGEAQRALIPGLERYVGNLEKVNKVAKLGALGQWARDASQLGKNMNQAFTGALDGFIDDLAEGKASFADFAKALLKDIMKIILKALIAKAILAAIGMATGGGPSADTVAGLNSSAQEGIAANPGIFHTGGVIGGKAPATRSVDSSVFNFAKKYHTGGFPGLKANEVPIIAEKGEGVFTQEQMKALGGRQQSVAAAPTPPQVNIINQTSKDVEQENTNTRFDGEKFVVDILLKNSQKPGPVRDLFMQGKK